MKNLVSHLLENNRHDVETKSLFNCHCVGLHSIMLLDSPEKRIRLYIADGNHELWMNDRVGFLDGSASIGFHAHHCDITLDVFMGELGNDGVIIDPAGKYDFKKYRYDSAINGGSGKFVLEGREKFKPGSFILLKAGDSIRLSSKSIHTVWVKRGESAAWFVYEGKEDPNYVPYTYSSADLENVSSKGLYRKPSYIEIGGLLASIGLY